MILMQIFAIPKRQTEAAFVVSALNPMSLNVHIQKLSEFLVLDTTYKGLNLSQSLGYKYLLNKFLVVEIYISTQP